MDQRTKRILGRISIVTTIAVAATHHDIHIPPPANVRTLTLVPA